MKYLRLHNLLVIVIIGVFLLIEIVIVYIVYYTLYVLWNFEIPKNFWLITHSYVSDWNWENVHDKNPWQTFIRRYKILME